MTFAEQLKLLLRNVVENHGVRSLILLLDTLFLGKLIECSLLQENLEQILKLLEVSIECVINFVKTVEYPYSF